jgi:hypothetical protein
VQRQQQTSCLLASVWSLGTTAQRSPRAPHVLAVIAPSAAHTAATPTMTQRRSVRAWERHTERAWCTNDVPYGEHTQCRNSADGDVQQGLHRNAAVVHTE